MDKKKFLVIIFIALVIVLTLIAIVLKVDKREFDEPTIEVKIANKKIEAVINSYCDVKKCVDKKAPYEMDYDEMLDVREGEKLYLLGLENDIDKVDLIITPNEYVSIDYSNKEKSIIVPSMMGEYVIVVRSKYNYSFKINIVEVENSEVVSLSEKFILDEIVDGEYDNFRLLRVLEYGYYPNKKDEKYVQLDFYVTCQNDDKCVKIAHKTDDVKDYTYYSLIVKVRNNKITFTEDGGFNSSVIQTHKVYMSVME